MSPRFEPASVTELNRVGLLATLPGETLRRLAARMEREYVPAGLAAAYQPVQNPGLLNKDFSQRREGAKTDAKKSLLCDSSASLRLCVRLVLSTCGQSRRVPNIKAQLPAVKCSG